MNSYLRSKGEDGASPADIIVPSLFGIGIGIAVAAVLLLAVGAIVYSTADPNKLLTAASMAILAASSFAVGFAGSKKSGTFLPGLIAGAVFALCLFAASLATESGAPAIPSPHSYLVRLGGIAVSALGAYLGSKKTRGGRFSASPKAPKIKKMQH